MRINSSSAVMLWDYRRLDSGSKKKRDAGVSDYNKVVDVEEVRTILKVRVLKKADFIVRLLLFLNRYVQDMFAQCNLRSSGAPRRSVGLSVIVLTYAMLLTTSPGLFYDSRNV
ncbi:hypothetical protein WN51_11177 [Melipona quadrifasciata]|uniref:Uncharacterized protein n=1 Tax=Melipona quadrifasciata TaxID=166423 RepID=A0A0M9A443_9HYME|nr:hypothetical protein WN51_11177 [Melipona quadrifasciata]